ncbi:MAG: ABC-type zinc uptake system permease component ZnuB [Rhodobacteraceae bacterium HLUCCA08]|nr:MAG: ABC-type zinc uptake system permease component ZnuB [Rhodobacteraceae bacterium HLUCCA08]
MALTRRHKIGWGLADLGVSTFVVVKQMLVVSYLTTMLGVPVAVAGWATAMVLAFDVVTDPVIGVLSDRTRSRWGRRAPWIAGGAVVMAGAIVGMFAVPEAMTWQANMTWLVGFFALATLGFTCVAIPYGAMAGEMTRDRRERTMMTAWRMTFASIGLLIAGAVLPAIAGDTRAGHVLGAALMAPVIVAAIWGMLWATRDAPKIAEATALRPISAARLVLGNRPFALLVLLYAIMTLSVALIAAGLKFAADYLIGDSAGGPLGGLIGGLGVFSALFAMFILGAVASQAFWAWASLRWGKLTALAAGLVLYALVLGATYFVLPAEGAGLMALMFFGAGIANGAYQQIPWAMYPDHMDITRDASGEALEGGFAAVWLFGQKVSNALGPALLGIILAGAGWQESTGGRVDQSPEALEALRRAMTIWPAGFFLVALVGLVLIYRPVARGLHDHS